MRYATLVSFLILYQTESHTHSKRGMENISGLKPIPRVCFQQQVVLVVQFPVWWSLLS